MKKFNTFLNEKLIIPDTQFVYDILNKNKNKIISCKTIEEAHDILNDIFNDYWIIVDTSENFDEYCLNSKWSIFGGMTNTVKKSDIGGVVTLILGKDFVKKLKHAKLEWKSFCDAIESVIGHEFIHIYQINKIPIEIHDKTLGKEVDKKEYLEQQVEIEAFAYQAVKEFMLNGYTPDQVIKRIKRPYDDNIKPGYEVSDAFWSYIYYFKINEKPLKKFLRYIYEYCVYFLENKQK